MQDIFDWIKLGYYPQSRPSRPNMIARDPPRRVLSGSRRVCPDGFRLIGCLRVPQDKVTAAGVSERISIKRHAPRNQIFRGQVGFFYAHRERIQVANERL